MGSYYVVCHCCGVEEVTVSIYEKLRAVQVELHAPKNQTNKFGGYNYRSAEDILEAVKPVLAVHELTLVIGDEMVQVADRVYVKSTATVFDSGAEGLGVSGWAREAADKKGMDASQITGAASSYARKYALNGLFAIDDSRDADATNDHGKASSGGGGSKAPTGKPGGPTVASVGALFQSKGIAPDVVKAELRNRGFQGLSDVHDESVLAELVLWAEGVV